MQEHWIVDPELESIEIYRRTEGGFGKRNELILERCELLTTPLLSGLEVPLT